MATQPDDDMTNMADMPLNGGVRADDIYEPEAISAAAGWSEEEETPDSARGPRILWVAAIVSIAWLAAAAALFWLIGQEMQLEAVTLIEWAAVAAGLFAPLTAIWLIALVIARIDPGKGRETLARMESAEARFNASAARVRDQVDGIDRLLLAVSERLDGLGNTLNVHGAAFEGTTSRASETARALSTGLAEDRERLDETIARLAERGETTHARLAELNSILPDAEAQTERIGTSLQGHGDAALRRIEELEARLSALDERERVSTQGALTRASTANELLTHIDQTARDIEALLDERGEALSTTVDAALERAAHSLAEHRAQLGSEIDSAAARTAAALDQTRGELSAEIDGSLSRTADVLERARVGLGAQADALNAAIEQANLSLEDTGRTAAADIETRLAGLSARAETLALEFTKQDERSAALFDASEGRFAELERRLAEVAAQGESVFAGYEGRIGSLSAEADALSVPLSETRSLVAALETGVANIRSQIGQTLAAFETQLPEMSAARQADMADLQQRVADLRSEFAELETQAGALTAPIEGARSDIGNATREIEQARTALETTTARLGSDLSNASAALMETQQLAEGTALGAASQLIEALGRVRDVAAQASESVRQTLAGVVDEAVEALGRASSDTLENPGFCSR